MDEQRRIDTLTLEQLKSALINASELVIESEKFLTELDTIIGDGDHGETMKVGFSALANLLQNEQYDDAEALFIASGMELLRVMGGASGVIFGTLFIGGRDILKGKKTVTAQDLISVFESGFDSIKRRGRSQPGDKTMLDALSPAISEMKRAYEEGGDISRMLVCGYEGAKFGAEATKNMLPRIGRSKNFRDKALGYADPGAISVSIIFLGMSQYISKIGENINEY